MQIIRVADQPDVPWKNGGGTTRELLSARGSDHSSDWRISVATIARDGPFSCFPGVDRTLVGLAGSGTLAISDRLVEVQPGAILRFGGDEPVSAIVGSGALRALNIMTTAREWVQRIGTPRSAGAAPWQDERPHMFAVLRETTRFGLQPGDLIRDVTAQDALDGIATIEIRLLRREAPPPPLPAGIDRPFGHRSERSAFDSF